MDEKNINNSNEKSQLLLLLNEEISVVNQRDKKPGWTIWALMAGLSTCTWLLINQFNEIEINWILVCTMLICLTLIFFLMKSFKIIFPSNFSNSNGDGLFSAKEIFSSSRFTFALISLWVGIIFYFAYEQKYLISNWKVAISLFFLGFIIVTNIFALIASTKSSIVLPLNSTTKAIGKTRINMVIPKILIISLNIIAVYSWLEYVLQPGVFSIYEFKISLLITVIYLIIVLISSLGSESFLLNTLMNLRRELILDQLPVNQIKKNLELTLKGQKAHDYFKNEITQLINYQQLFEKHLHIASEKLKIFSDDKNLKPIIADSINQSILVEISSAANIILDDLKSLRKKTRFKIIWLETIIRLEKNQNPFEEFSNSLDTNIDTYNGFVKKWHSKMVKIKNIEYAASMIDELHKLSPKLNFNRTTAEVVEE